MHISETPQPDATNVPLTKCPGMNGAADGGGSPPACKEEPGRSPQGPGGRLKFFKDGKFILELERACDGDKMSWVSVPRKTFWPPQGTTVSTPTYRQESSASLSVSDDNSSVQSSPWQRDHSWKQATPKRGVSKELCFSFRRGAKSGRTSLPRSKRRKLQLGATPRSTPCNKSVAKPRPKLSLLAVVQMLSDKGSAGLPPRSENVVSPRKRFLREMETCKLPPEEKRSRCKAQGQGVKEPRARSNYSITSLLADDHGGAKRRSPEGGSPSHFPQLARAAAAAAAAYCCSPAPEDVWYSESVDRLRSMELSQVEKRVMSSYAPYPPCIHHHYAYPYSLPLYTSGGYGRAYNVVPSMYSMTALPMVRPDVPSCSWTGDSSARAEHRDENVSDLPLNLSKHAG